MADIVVLYDDVQYTKNDWRNRNKILTSQGPTWLTIPVQHHNLSQKICNIHVANQHWRRKHWRSIELSYGKAPYFDQYRDDLASLYQSEETSLSKINFHFLSYLCQQLGLTTRWKWSFDFQLPNDRNQRLVELLGQLDVTNYISGPAAKQYLDRTLFQQSEIDVRWIDYSDYDEYPQFNNASTFEQSLSILDLLFNVGDEAIDYLNATTQAE